MFQFIYSESLEYIMDNLRDESHAYNVSMFKQALHNWDTSNAGQIVYFDTKNDQKDLTLFLTDSIKNSQIWSSLYLHKKKVCTRFKNKGEQFCERSFSKSKSKMKIHTKLFT